LLLTIPGLAAGVGLAFRPPVPLLIEIGLLKLSDLKIKVACPARTEVGLCKTAD
jgi:hypothetical protein